MGPVTTMYRYVLTELHFPVFAVYDNDGIFEAAFAREADAEEYVRNHSG
jgi:hypothetical protein